MKLKISNQFRVQSSSQLRFQLAMKRKTTKQVALELGISAGVLYRQFHRVVWDAPTPRGLAFTERLKKQIKNRYGITIAY